MRVDEPHLAACGTSRFARPLPERTTMSTPSSFKTALIAVLSLVLLSAGIAVLVGVFGLLIRLFGHG